MLSALGISAALVCAIPALAHDPIRIHAGYRMMNLASTTAAVVLKRRLDAAVTRICEQPQYSDLDQLPVINQRGREVSAGARELKGRTVIAASSPLRQTSQCSPPFGDLRLTLSERPPLESRASLQNDKSWARGRSAAVGGSAPSPDTAQAAERRHPAAGDRGRRTARHPAGRRAEQRAATRLQEGRAIPRRQLDRRTPAGGKPAREQDDCSRGRRALEAAYQTVAASSRSASILC